MAGTRHGGTGARRREHTAPPIACGPRRELVMTGTPGGGQGRGEQVTHPILAGYDGSASSRHALAYAAGMARRQDGYLIVWPITHSHIPAGARYNIMLSTSCCG